MADQTTQAPVQQPAPAPQAAPQPEKKNQAKALVDEFKTFIARGNVLDMAVGVIVGGAFTSIVNALVDDILMPIIGTLMIGINFHTLGFSMPWGDRPFIAIGSFIQAIIVFLLTALCVFAIVKIVNIFVKKKPVVPKPTKQEELLMEIRDLLKEQQQK